MASGMKFPKCRGCTDCDCLLLFCLMVFVVSILTLDGRHRLFYKYTWLNCILNRLCPPHFRLPLSFVAPVLCTLSCIYCPAVSSFAVCVNRLFKYQASGWLGLVLVFPTFVTSNTEPASTRVLGHLILCVNVFLKSYCGNKWIKADFLGFSFFIVDK